MTLLCLHKHPAGFTLFELLAATAITSVLLVALSMSVLSALQLRADAQEALEHTLQYERVANLIQNDIELMASPTGILAGAVYGVRDESAGDVRLDSLEFYAASGILTETDPWGDIQEIHYYLAEPEDVNDGAGYNLIRTITRNLLPSTEEEPDEIPILQGVQSLTFTYYDGESWADSWDSTLLEDEAPEGVYVCIEMIPEDTDTEYPPQIELYCMVLSQSISSTADTSGEAM